MRNAIAEKAQDTQPRESLAQAKLDEIAMLERELENAHDAAERLQEEISRIEGEVASRRDELARLVRENGGSLDVPGLARPLHIKLCRTLLYDSKPLLPWLKRNAPQFVRESVEMHVDRRALKKDLHFLRSRAYLPGAKSPVRGIRVIETERLVIPGRQEEEEVTA